MAVEKILIAELDFDTTALVKSAEKAQLALDELKASQVGLGVRTEENTAQFIENEVAQKKVRDELNQHKKALVALTDSTGKQVDVTSKMNTELTKEVKSIDTARASNKELNAIRNKLNLSTEEGRKALIAVNAKLDENNKFIKENVDQYTKQKIGIGDYEGALKRVFPQLNGVIDGLKSTKEGLTNFGTTMKASIIPTGGLSGALKVLKVALISTGVGALVVALGSLITFLSTTQAGIDAVTSVTRPLQAIFSSFKGVVQNLGKSLFDAFSKPKVLLSDLLDFLKGQVVNRLKSFAVILEGIKDFDTKKITDGLFQLTTGVKDVTTKIANVGKEASKIAQEAIAKGKEIDRLTKEIERSEINLVKQRALSSKIIKENNKIAEDTTKTLAEREASAARAIAESEKILGFEQSIIDKKIARIKIEQTLNDTSREGELELAELEASRDDKKTASLELQTTLTNKLNTIRKEGITNQVNADKKETEEAKKKSEAEQKELDRLRAFEDKKRDLINEIDLQNAGTQEEKDTLKLTQDYEKELIELERLEATETEKGELKKLIVDRYNNEVNQLVEDAAQRRVEIENQAAVSELEIQEMKGQASLQIAQQIGSTLLGILGDSLGGQLAAIALNAIIDIAKLKIATASAQQINLANATATAAPPFNIPFITAAIAQNAVLGAKSKVQQGSILASAAISGVSAVAKNIAGKKKAEKGGLFEIGGARHSQGGTKFFGEDGTSFEAERGELIGVMSRTASEQFMKFNNQFTQGTSAMGNYFANGGIVNRSAPNAIDIKEIIQTMPPMQVDVKDIIKEVNNRVSLVDGANR